ncbi:MAG TPA: thioredoxin [Candidatus Caccomorpha excrementavium]|nr:thioredoxin [Candidatus Caccomorpha excrementavium]
MAVKTITSENFEQEVLKAEKTVLIDFWAEWCGPCRMLSPVVDQVAEEMGDQIIVGKVNVDEQPALAQKFNIMSIPTLLVFKNGSVVQTSVGVRPKQEIVNLVR